MTTIYCAKCELAYKDDQRSTVHPEHPYLIGSRGWIFERIIRFVTRNW
jgi:hypothetical protein